MAYGGGGNLVTDRDRVMRQPLRRRRSQLWLVVATLGLGIAMLFLHASRCEAVDVAGSTSDAPGVVSTLASGEHSSPDEGCDHSNHSTATAAVASSFPADVALLGLAFLALAVLPLWQLAPEWRVRGVAMRARPPVPLPGRVLLRFVCVSRT